MKVLAWADPHGSPTSLKNAEKKAKDAKVDYILCVGDLTIFEQNLDELVQKIDKWNIPILMIHGNHEEKSVLEYVCNKTKNVKFVHNKSFRVGNILILASGGGGFATYDSKFEDVAEEWLGEIKKDDTVVMMVHHPPFKVLDTVDGEHTGSKSILKYIKKIKPKFCFIGHLHEHFDKEDTVKKTRVINPGPGGKVFEL